MRLAWSIPLNKLSCVIWSLSFVICHLSILFDAKAQAAWVLSAFLKRLESRSMIKHSAFGPELPCLPMSGCVRPALTRL